MMNVWHILLAVLATVGAFTLVHTLASWGYQRMLKTQGHAELLLYGEGDGAQAEQLIRLALYIRRHYLPALAITFVETGHPKGENVALRMSIREEFTYQDFE